jgi:hypothetical protein
MKVSFLLVSALAAADAFSTPTLNRASIVHKSENSFISRIVRFSAQHDDHDDFELETGPLHNDKPFNPIPTLTAAMITFSSNAAYADSPDWGIFEGKTGSLLHPVMMFSLLALSVSTALLGFEWRRQVRSCRILANLLLSRTAVARLLS